VDEQLIMYFTVVVVFSIRSRLLSVSLD